LQKSKLDRLAALANVPAGPDQVLQPPKVETSLLWDLLDYANSTAPTEYPGGASGDLELNVNTHFLNSPLHDSTPLAGLARPIAQLSEDPITSDIWDEASFAFDMVDFSNLPDVSTLTMPTEFWTNGHL
jgi:hypothetical protein